MALVLTLSYWVDVNRVKAITVLNRGGSDQWYDYYPASENMYLSYSEIRDAYAAGTLTGPGVTPIDYPRPPLEQQKLDKIALFENNTKYLQSEGYKVTVNGTEYVWDTLGERADRNWIWLAILAILTLMGVIPQNLVPFPRNVRAKDDTVVTLATAADAVTFLLQLKIAEQTLLDEGAALRKAVSDATTQEELDAIVDPRV
jgi:hypothetical protein